MKLCPKISQDAQINSLQPIYYSFVIPWRLGAFTLSGCPASLILSLQWPFLHTSNEDSDNLAGRSSDIGLGVTTNTIAKKFLSLASYMFRTLRQFNVPSDNVIFLPASPGSKM